MIDMSKMPTCLENNTADGGENAAGHEFIQMKAGRTVGGHALNRK